MPLYNVQNRGMKFAPLGSIRKGMQVPVVNKETGKPKKRGGEIVTRPKEMPYFIFHPDAAREEQIMGKLVQVHGGLEIKAIDVLLAYPDPSKCWSCWMEAYNNSQLIARSDERVITYLFDTASNETLIKDSVVIAHSSAASSAAGLIVKDIPIGSPVNYVEDMVVSVSKSSNTPIKFAPVGRLTVVIPELHKGENPLPFGTWKVVTGGYWMDIPQIDSTMQMVESICKLTGCGANMIPLLLRRSEVETSYVKEDGSQGKRISYPLQLDVRGDVISGLLEKYDSSPFETFLLEQPTQAPALNSPVDVEENFEDSVVEPIIPEALNSEYEEARKFIVSVRGTEKFMDELTDEQLVYASTHGKPEQQNAAKIVLDYRSMKG